MAERQRFPALLAVRALPVGGSDLSGEVHDEAPVLVELLGRDPPVEHRHRASHMCQRSLGELFGRAVALAVHLRPSRDDRVEQLSPAMLTPR